MSEEESPILNDYVFKQVFGQEDDNPILISFLNAMLDGDINIKHVTILNSEIPRLSEMGRTILLDVQAQTDDGTYIDIEVQNGYREDLIDRMFIYGTNMVSKYSKKATRFDSTICIAIWILNCRVKEFNHFGNDPIIGEFVFRSKLDSSKYLPLKELKIYPIELKKGLDVLNLSPKKQTWINFLMTSDNSSNPVEIKEVHEAYDKVKNTTASKKYKTYIEAVEKAEKLRLQELLSAKEEAIKQGLQKGIKQGKREGLKQGKEEGLKQGKEEGLKQGKEEGLKQGKEEGLKQGKEEGKKEMARNMLKDNVNINTISKYTGLTIEEIQELTKDR